MEWAGWDDYQRAKCSISKKRVETFEQVINWDKILETKMNLETWKEERVEYLDPNALNAIVLTEEDLVNMTNWKLRRSWYKENTITYRTFKTYKAKIKSWAVIPEDAEWIYKYELMAKLKDIVMDAIAIQKARLFKNLTTWPANNWQKYAWIIERKYDSWNIRQKTEDVNVTKAMWLAELAKASLEEDTKKAIEKL